MKVNIVTIEGDPLVLEVETGCRTVQVPLKEIKRYRYCDILNQRIPEHFREIFEFREYVIINYLGEHVRKQVYFHKEII